MKRATPSETFTVEYQLSQREGEPPPTLFHWTRTIETAASILRDGAIVGRPYVNLTENPALVEAGSIGWLIDTGRVLTLGFEIVPTRDSRYPREAEWRVRRGGLAPARLPLSAATALLVRPHLLQRHPDLLDELRSASKLPVEVFEWDEWWEQRHKIRRNPSPLDNPAFRRWFGTSEVVDENGEPRVMYHATFSPFTTFRVDHLGDEYHRFGFHVGPEDAAMMRIEVKLAESARDRVKESRDKARLMPLYVRAEAPLRLDENRTGRWGVDDVMAALMQKADSEGIDGVSDDMLDDYHEDALVLPKSGGRLWADHHEFRDGERSAILINFLRELGYDSIIYQNEFEGGGDSYLLLDPRQVKSATDNAGTYDPSDPSILKNPAFPTALYHATPQRNLDSILQRGLLASKSSVTLSSGGGVFLTDEKSLARGYAERRFGVDDYDEPWLLLKIDPVQLDPSRFEADPGQEAELNAEDIEARGYTILTMPWWVSLEETGQMVYAGNVPPGAIEPVEIMLPSKGDSWEPVRVQRNRRTSRPKRTSRRRR